MNQHNRVYVYDKAKYHVGTTTEYGLPDSHASHHTLYFFRWLIDNGLMSETFLSDAEPLGEYQSGQRTLLSLYEWWDCCLVDTMLSEEGNAFARQYFDFEKGRYIRDYIDRFKGDLPSEFHIAYNDEIYEKFRSVIDKRYSRWKAPKRWWWPF